MQYVWITPLEEKLIKALKEEYNAALAKAMDARVAKALLGAWNWGASRPVCTRAEILSELRRRITKLEGGSNG